MASSALFVKVSLIVALFVIGSVHSASLRCLPMYCPEDSCEYARCTNHPSAICVLDLCAGCQTEFYDNGQKVTDCQG